LSLAAGASAKLWELPAHELARLIAKRELSAVEVVREHIARIEEMNPKLNAVVYKRYEAALKEAADADSRLARGDILKPLHRRPGQHQRKPRLGRHRVDGGLGLSERHSRQYH
jgi:amidase